MAGRGRRMAKGNPDSGRVVIKSNAAQRTTPLSSYFFGITIPQTTIRIRIPRLLAKTLQRGGNGCADGNGDHARRKKKVTWGKPEKHLGRKVGSVLSGVFGKKNSPGYYKVRESDDGGELEILKKVESDDDDDGDGLCVEDKHLAVAPESPSFMSLALDHAEGEERAKLVKKTKKRGMADEFFSIRTGLKSSRREMDEKDASGGLGCGCISRMGVDRFADMLEGDDLAVILRANGVSSVPNSAASTAGFASGSQQKGSNLPRIRSKVLTIRRKLKMVRSVKKVPKRRSEGKPEQCDEEGEDGGGEELCKKRILMGGRCKPLHSLQYDRDGRLLPEFTL